MYDEKFDYIEMKSPAMTKQFDINLILDQFRGMYTKLIEKNKTLFVKSYHKATTWGSGTTTGV